MLKNIKSAYIIKYITNYLDEKRKLILVMKNKALQHKINIGIINYQILSNLYNTTYFKSKDEDCKIKRGINGKNKEYDSITNQLIFEGTFLRGKRNGKGKEYDHLLNILYEGEYKNGKKNGKGKEYYNNNNYHVNKDTDLKLKFEGEYINGKKWTGKGYDFNKKLIYEIKKGKGLIKNYNVISSKFFSFSVSKSI